MLLILKAGKAGTLLSPLCDSAQPHSGTLQEAFLYVLTWGCSVRPWRWKAHCPLQAMLPSRALSAQACQEPAIPRSKSHPQEKLLDDQDSLSHLLFFCGLGVTETSNPARTSPGKTALVLRSGGCWWKKIRSMCAENPRHLCSSAHTALPPAPAGFDECRTS